MIQILIKNQNKKWNSKNWDFIKDLYFKLSFLHIKSNGENSNYYKQFLDIVFEIKLILTKWINQYNESSLRNQKYHFDINSKEDLMKMLIERTSNYPLNKHNDKYFSVLYSSRSYLSLLFGNLYEYWFWQLKKVSVLIQTNKANIEKLSLFKHLDKLKDLIPDFELEKAKYQRLIGEKLKAKDYLEKNLDYIEEKFDYISNNINWSKHILNNNLMDDIWYFLFEVMLELDPSCPKINEKFKEYFKNTKYPTSEKTWLLYATYIDNLIAIDKNNGQIYCKDVATSYSLRDWIRYYFESINKGNSLLWHTLPRILEIWFQLTREQVYPKYMIKDELLKLDTYKIAQILQTLLSKFSYDGYRDSIAKLVSKVAVEYPAQSAWWLSHFKQFYAITKEAEIDYDDKDKREKFAEQVEKEVEQLLIQSNNTNKIKYDGDIEVEANLHNINKIFEDTSDLMNALIEFGRSQIKSPQRENDIPIYLMNFDFKSKYVIMPIHSNLTPNFPKSSENMENFSWYNPNPVRITGILSTCVVMNSNEQPKRIGFIGSDKKVYHFLLKFDELGDLRKEARFMSYASLINTIFENDPECKSRNLSLHTYSVVPLSRSTGLIEWMPNTKTIKNMIWTKWSDLGVKADLASISEVRKLVKDNKISTAWDEIMIITKDVLWECLRERFPTAEAMFNCRTKFIYSYAAWCIIGYFIGLGDRHWDNIMLHSNTGEVSHVDFDLIFESGKKLEVVERVPFRLTRNVIDVFGVLKEKFKNDPIFVNEYSLLKENPEEYLRRISDKISCNDVLLNNEQTISSFTPIYLPVKINIV